MRYELINPSDYAEFRSETREDALVAVLVLGGGLYGARRLDVESPSDDVPVWIFGVPADAVQLVEKALAERPSTIADVLNSLCLPRTNRTSINDFCAKARRIAQSLAATNPACAEAE